MRAAERFTVPVAYHGEGPFWDSRRNRLLCMDVLAGTVVAVSLDAAVERYEVPTKAATVIRRRAGSGYILATEHGVVVADEELAEFVSLAELTRDSSLRTNDGGCDPLGAFVIGTMSYRGEPGAGTVYRVAPSGEIAELLAPVTISNGMQWSADGARVYYIDTPTRCVDVFDVDKLTGAWSGRRTHIEVSSEHGSPDGMAIDEDGGLWVALWGGGAVHHYDASGRLVESIAVPGVTQVSSCAFGGQDLATLFITTSREGLPTHQEPDAGAVFAHASPVRGVMPLPFAG